MRLLGKKLSDLNKLDFERLIDNKITESIMLDYKLELPKPNDAGKKEFLADITAMANTVGGLIIYGLKEAKEDGHNAGYPDEIVGLKATDGSEINVEILKQWFDSVTRDGIEPRIQGMEYHDYLYYGKLLFIVSIPRSLLAPHMVKFAGDSRFFSRTTTGKYKMDVSQIKDAFLRTDEWKSYTEQFRRERVESYFESTPGEPTEAAVLIHILPIGEREFLDLKGKANEISRMLPSNIFPTGYSTTYNFDGVIKRSNDVSDYIQIFRNGGIEVFEALNVAGTDKKGGWQLFLDQITIATMKYLHSYLVFTDHYNITPPFAIYLNVINMKGAYVRLGSFGGSVPFADGKERLLFPGVLIEDSTINIDESLRPTFDMLYQSCGASLCPSYTPSGSFNLDYIEEE